MKNQETIITDFLDKLDFRIVESTRNPRNHDHKAIALATRMPSNIAIPVGKKVFLNLIYDGGLEYLAQFDIEPVEYAPGWFFVIRTVSS